MAALPAAPEFRWLKEVSIMAKIIFDANGWQSVKDFETGETIENYSDERVRDWKKLMATLPYPGDTSIESIDWVFRSARTMHNYYDPEFLFISIATPKLMKTNELMTPADIDAMNRQVFDGIESFIADTEYEPIVVGMSDMIQIKEIIPHKGLAPRLCFASNYFPYVGIFSPTEEEHRIVDTMKHVTIHTKEELRRYFPAMSDKYANLMPDLLLMLEEGYSFTNEGNRGFTLKMLPKLTREFPVYTTLAEKPTHIQNIRATADRALDAGKRVALIMMESTGFEDFRLPYTKVDNSHGWFIYDHGITQYLATVRGKPFYENPFPLIPETRKVKHHVNKHPYSLGFLASLPHDGIGCRPDKRTAAVGSRSGITHHAVGADLAFECHSRELSPSGTLAFINDPK
jgi:hypothetical protein